MELLSVEAQDMEAMNKERRNLKQCNICRKIVITNFAHI